MNGEPRHVSLEARIEALAEETGGKVDVADIAGIVTSLLMTMDGDVTLMNLHLQDEIRQLVDYIEAAKTELHGLQPQNMSQSQIPAASDELDAVVAATEDAAGKIMDAAEEIQAIAATADQAIRDSLEAVAARIYEASSFQDITGQRVTKVVRTLQILEERLSALAVAIGDTHVDAPEEVQYDEHGNVINEKALLHGPQLPTAANNQDDIDALLASFD